MKDDGNTFQTGPNVVTPSDTPTPRTDAARIMYGFQEVVMADFARQLERELAAEREKLQEERTTSDFLANAIEGTMPPEQAIARYNKSLANGARGIMATTVFQKLAAERDILEEVLSALNAAGCPAGNEHKTYSIVERIAWLHKTGDYAWKQMDEGRANLEALRQQVSMDTECIERIRKQGETDAARLEIARTKLRRILEETLPRDAALMITHLLHDIS